jgi:hypothetical protein
MNRNHLLLGLPLWLASITTLVGCPESNHNQNDASHHVIVDAGPADGRVDANVNAPRCSDGVDNDGDGLIDYPDDPGCDDANDGDESNPAYCGLDAFGEMILVRNLPPTGHLVQNTEYGWNHHQGSCGGADAPEMVFLFTVTDDISGIQISTVGDPTLLDSVVYVRKDVCDGTAVEEVGCDAPAGALGATVDILDPEPGNYYIFVDGGSAGANGQFLLEVRGLIPEGGACDPNSQTLVCAKGLICAGNPTVCKVPLCNDGIDNDGDDIIDFPLDPGCSSDLDDTEDDACPGVGCPECADGIDNDGDGFTDYPDDPGCQYAGDPIELDACMTGLDLLPLPSSGVVTGTINPAQGSYTQGSCTQYSSGPETVYPINLPFGALELSVEMSTANWTYPVLYVRQDDCRDGDELGCVFDWNSTQRLRLLNLEPGTYFIFADTSDVYQTDQFTLRVSVLLPVGAVCDPASPLGRCGPGGTCSNAGGAGYVCEPTRCNDGIDNDSDGYTDWPNDPGCADVSDDDEADTCNPAVPATCPACFNGLDDDGDGNIDFPADPGCAAAGDVNEINECLPGLVVEVVDSGTETGTIEQAAQSYIQPSCNSWTYGEDVWQLDLPYGAGTVDVSLSSSNLDLVLYLRRGDCGTAPDEQCKQTWGGGGNPPAQATLNNVAPGKVFVFADTSYIWNNISGTYTLQFNVGLPRDAPCQIGNPLMGCAAGAVCQDTGGGVYRCVGTACNDGLDNDGDGKVDYPNDPGCVSISDNNETDPAVPPLCSDGLDNDGDGLTDYPADPGCTSAADTNELDECGTGLMVEDITLTGTGSGLPTGPSRHEGSCNNSGYPEDVYLLRSNQPLTQVRATVTSLDWNMQPVLFVRQGDCESASAELACNNNWSTTASVTLNNLAAGNLYFFVDSSYSQVQGQYTFVVEATLPAGATCDPSSTVIRCPGGTTCTDTGSGWVCE